MDPYQEVKEALSDYFAAITEKKGAEELLKAIQNLDACGKRHSDEVDPMLRHFLKGQSYQKAWDHLQARAAGN